MKPEQINSLPPELRKLWEIREKSTSGPWQTRFMYRMFKRVRESPGDLLMDSNVEQDWPDAEFCAEAHNLIPELFSYILQVVGAKDAAYSERDNLVAALSKVFPSSLERHPDSDTTWEDDWRWIVFIDLPTGQATWHIHDSEVTMFDHLPRHTGKVWDGHTTPQKYFRLAAIETATIATLTAERDEALKENNQLHITAEGLSTSLGAQRMGTQDQANRANAAEAEVNRLRQFLYKVKVGAWTVERLNALLGDDDAALSHPSEGGVKS